VAQDEVVSRHGRLGILCLEGVGHLSGFAGSSRGEVNVVDVGTRGGRGRRVLRGGDGKEQK